MPQVFPEIIVLMIHSTKTMPQSPELSKSPFHCVSQQEDPLKLPLIGPIAIASFTPWAFRQFMHMRGVLEKEACDHEEVTAWVWLLKHKRGGISFGKIIKSFPSKDRKQLTERTRTQLAPMPLQVMWAQEEISIPNSQCGYIRYHFNMQEIHQVPGRHFLQLESAATIIQKIHQFLQDQEQKKKDNHTCSTSMIK